jgi:ribosomal protein L18E
VAWNLNEKPTIVVVGKLTKADGVTPPAGVFSMSWTYTTKNQIALTFQGLDAGTAYKVIIEGRC